MAFPSVLSTFNRPNATDRLNSPSHSALHNTISSALGQVEAVIGVDGANSILGTIMGDLRSPGSSGGGHVQTANKGGTGQTTYTKGDILIASSSSVLGKQSIGTDGQILIADSTQALGIRWGGGKFGGTGADGALTITTGTTTLPVASVQTFVKNYTSISITGSGKLGFSSPHDNGTVVILKSQGNVTISSSAGSVISVGAFGAKATNPGYSYAILQTFPGGAAPGGGAGGGGGSIAALSTLTFNTSTLGVKYANVVPGAGGNTAGAIGGGGGGGSFVNTGSNGSGGANTSSTTPGVGGRGGGVLIIECGGQWNFTSGSGGLVASGQNGTNGGGGNDGGGGGGGAGQVIVAVASIVANTGTIEVKGGLGGAKTGTGGNGGAGGDGYSLVTTNTDFL